MYGFRLGELRGRLGEGEVGLGKRVGRVVVDGTGVEEREEVRAGINLGDLVLDRWFVGRRVLGVRYQYHLCRRVEGLQDVRAA